MLKKMMVFLVFLACCLLVAPMCLAAPQVGDAPPQIIVNDANGQKVELLKFDKVTVINFWATWCPPCRAELPGLAQFASNNEGSVQFYGIDLQESPQVVEAFLAEQKLVLPVVYDRDGQVARMFAVRFIPTTIVTDAQGIIVFRKSGPVTAEELTGVLNQ